MGVKLGCLERFFHLEGFFWVWFVSYTQSENVYLVKIKKEKHYRFFGLFSAAWHVLIVATIVRVF